MNSNFPQTPSTSFVAHFKTIGTFFEGIIRNGLRVINTETSEILRRRINFQKTQEFHRS